ncbi:MAG: cation diffusion facilitator family transporter [Candidatus Aenigmarchaeota archaeon]|nr:cation diffusion facilitator family transporter [Candidatus Aenigmarchaeota archaeon]
MESVRIDRLKEGEKISKIVILVNIVLAALKALIGHFSGSIVLITDAVHTVSDSVTNFASWFGLKIAQKEPDENFPYGYYRAETISTLFISLFLLFAGYKLITESYSKLFTLKELEIPYLALGVSLVSSIVAFFISRYEEEVGKRINSRSLIALSQESRIDIFTSLLVFVGVFSTYLGIYYIEGIVGILISLIVFRIAIENGKSSVLSLMDISPSKDIENKIKKIIEKTDGVEIFEDLKLRHLGPFITGEVKIKAKKHLTVKRSHEISDKIEENIRNEITDVNSFLIHVEPYEPKEQRIVIPVNSKGGIKSKLSDHFGRAKYYMFVNLSEGEISSTSFKENKYRDKKVRAGLFVVNKIITKKDIDAVLTKSIGAISLHTLRDNLVGVYLTKKNTVKDVIKSYNRGELKLLEEPTKKLGKESVEKRLE